MKRNINSFQTSIYQVQLDTNKFGRGNLDSLSGNENNTIWNLRDFLTSLTPCIDRDELVFFKNLWSQEIEDRTAALCESIPDDVWMFVFRSLSRKKDISTLNPVRLVNKRLYNTFSHSVNEAWILRAESLKGLPNLLSLRRLIIKSDCTISTQIFNAVFPKLEHLSIRSYHVLSPEVTPEMWTQMTSLTSLTLFESDSNQPKLINNDNFKYLSNLASLKVYFEKSEDEYLTSVINPSNLSHLRNLTHFNNCHDSYVNEDEIIARYGRNYSILDYFKHLKVATLYFLPSIAELINCKRIQEKYPSVRFIWGSYVCDPEKKKFDFFEGEFNEANLFHGKGTLTYFDSEKYEGEFHLGNREGRGTMMYSDSDIYDGQWKDNQREGKGAIIFLCGDRFECEWKNDERQPTGVLLLNDGGRYEGEFKNEEYPYFREGKGLMIYPNGDQYKGKWKNDLRNGNGVLISGDGNRYKGRWANDLREGEGVLLYSSGLYCHYDGSFKNDKKEGRGLMLYSNGDRYDGEWKNDKKEGRGVMIYSNGKKYEGEWKNDEKV